MSVTRICKLRRVWFAVAASVALTAPGGVQAQAPAGPPPAPVTVTTAAKRDVPVWLRGLGTVQAYYAAQMRSRVDGTLMQVPVQEGQSVKQGDVLAIVDPRPFQAALDAAKAKKQQDEAVLANAKADLTRYASLARQDFASRQKVDTQQALFDQLAATVAADTAQVEAAQLNLSFCYVRSPFDGRVGLRTIDPGNVVHANEAAAILSVTQIQPINVVFTLPQDTLPAIVQAMAGNKLDVVAYAADNKTELDRGVLLTPDNTIDAATGTIKLKATFPNTKNTLWPGQFVNAALLLGTERGALAVTVSAVLHGPNGLFVYLVGEGDKIAVKPIEVARQEGDVYVVSKGLEDGATIVATGQSRLQNGARVEIRKPEPAKTGS
jgi:multidrug efflux system membrane fusion protein